MTTNEPANEQPIVFSCGGKSHIGQIANDIAITLQKNHFASMGCIAAIANDLAVQLDNVRKSSSIIAIDACQYQCVKKCLSKKNIHINHYFNLSEIRDSLMGESNPTSNIQDIKSHCYLQKKQKTPNQTPLNPQPKKIKSESKEEKIPLVDAIRIMQTVYKKLNLKEF